MKKFIKIIILLTFFFPVIIIADDDIIKIVSKEPFFVSGYPSINIRKNHDINSVIIGQIIYNYKINPYEMYNKLIEINGKKGKWVHVKVDGIDGWIFDYYLSDAELRPASEIQQLLYKGEFYTTGSVNFKIKENKNVTGYFDYTAGGIGPEFKNFIFNETYPYIVEFDVYFPICTTKEDNEFEYIVTGWERKSHCKYKITYDSDLETYIATLFELHPDINQNYPIRNKILFKKNIPD